MATDTTLAHHSHDSLGYLSLHPLYLVSGEYLDVGHYDMSIQFVYA